MKQKVNATQGKQSAWRVSIWMLLMAVLTTSALNAQRKKAPMYFSAYAYLYTINSNQPTELYMDEGLWKHNIDYLSEHLVPLGFDMIATDGWGEAQRNEFGFLNSHHPSWDSTFAQWSAYAANKGVKIGIYDNPLWIDDQKPAIRHLFDSTANDVWFKWIKINTEETVNDQGDTLISARDHLENYIDYYADEIKTDYLRVDFLSWYEDGIDKINCYTERSNRPVEDYQLALSYLNEFCDAKDIQLSLVMPHLYNDAASERQFAPGSMIRVNEDAAEGGWYRLSEIARGKEHQIWSKYHNTFDGLTYWSIVSGFDDTQNEMILDGDFIWLSSFDTEDEKKSALSINLMAGGAIPLTEYYVEDIESSMYLLENEEVFALNEVGFVGKPVAIWNDQNPQIDNSLIEETSQKWVGQMPNGDFIVCLFNRDSMARTDSINFVTDIDSSLENVYVRDLWERKDLPGTMSGFSQEIPAHGCVMLRLSSEKNCISQSIAFEPIADKSPGTEFYLYDTTDTGQPVEFSMSKGRGTINWDVAQNAYLVKLGLGKDEVEIVASHPGDSIYCPAETKKRIFQVTGQTEYASEIFIGGNFNGWSPGRYEMRLQDSLWTFYRLYFEAGESYQMKFVDDMQYAGRRWGKASGMSGTVHLLLPHEDDNVTFTPPTTGYYKIFFNDLTLEYNIQEELPCTSQYLSFDPIGNKLTTDEPIDLTELVTLMQNGEDKPWKVNFSITSGHEFAELCRKKLIMKSCTGQVTIEASYNGSDTYCPAKTEQTFQVSDPPGAVQVQPGDTYSIVSYHSRNQLGEDGLKALDLYEGGQTSGTNIHQWQYYPALATQQWEVRDEGNCKYSLIYTTDESHEMALDLAAESRDNGGNVHLWEYYPEGEHNNQKWKIEWVKAETEWSGYSSTTRHFYKLISLHSDKALDIEEGSLIDGANIHQWDYFGGDSQLWELVEVNFNGRVTSSHSNHATNQQFSLFPNPKYYGERINLQKADAQIGRVDVVITSLTGEKIYHQKFDLSQKISIDQILRPGIYLILLTYNDLQESHKLIVK